MNELNEPEVIFLTLSNLDRDARIVRRAFVRRLRRDKRDLTSPSAHEPYTRATRSKSFQDPAKFDL